MVGQGTKNGRAQGTLLGYRLISNFVAGRPNQLVGQPIRSVGDLAALAQVYRDPRFETLRVVYLDQNSKVVGEAGYTSRLPGVAMAPPNVHLLIQSDRVRFGASTYFVMHNHPSGSSAPSPEDVDMTRTVASLAPGFRAHVIIDHNEYSVIDRTGGSRTVQAPQLKGFDFTGNPALPHLVLGRAITGSVVVTEIAKEIQVPQGHATLILTDRGGKVQLLVYVPMESLSDQSRAGIISPRPRADDRPVTRRLSEYF